MAISFFASQSGCRVLTAFPRTLGSRDGHTGDTAMSPGHMGDVLMQPPPSWHWALRCQAAWITPAGTSKRCSQCNTARITSHSSAQPSATSSTSLGDSCCLRRAVVVFQWQEIEAFCGPSAAAVVLSWYPPAPDPSSTKPAEPRMGPVLLQDGSSSISIQEEGETCAPGVPVSMAGGSGTLQHQPWHGTDTLIQLLQLCLGMVEPLDGYVQPFPS